MSVDTSVLLRIRDRPLFRRLVEAFAEARRSDGDRHDGYPTLWPLEDDSVIVGTVIRWDDRDMELAVRAFLTSLTAGRLGEVHDDPRGVYLCTDLALPRRKTYEGAVAELGGRFVSPAPPSPAELAAQAEASQAAFDRIEILYEALLEGDVEIFVRGLARASDSQRAFMTQEWGYRYPDKPLPTIPARAEAAPEPPPTPPPVFVAQAPRVVERPEDTRRGSGAVSVLLPASVGQLIDRGSVPNLAGARRIALDDGDAVYITEYAGDAVIAAAWLAAACIREGIDRTRVGPCAFFRESLAHELAASDTTRFTLPDALAALGDRAEMLSLLDWQERARENAAIAKAWLAEKG